MPAIVCFETALCCLDFLPFHAMSQVHFWLQYAARGQSHAFVPIPPAVWLATPAWLAWQQPRSAGRPAAPTPPLHRRAPGCPPPRSAPSIHRQKRPLIAQNPGRPAGQHDISDVINYSQAKGCTVSIVQTATQPRISSRPDAAQKRLVRSAEGLFPPVNISVKPCVFPHLAVFS